MAKASPAVRIGIVGGDSLIGRELRDMLTEKRLAETIDTFDDTEESAASKTNGEESEAREFLPRPTNEALANCRIVLLTGSKQSCRRVAAMRLTAPILDLTGNLSGSPDSVLRAPMAEPERYLTPEARITVVAHPAAIMLAMILRRVQQFQPIRHAAITVFEPASHRGLPGVGELQKQTIGLLGLHSFPSEVFDEQIGFNLLSRLGEDAPEPLADSSARMKADLAKLLSADPPAPMPSLRLAQAPVFNGYAASAWIDFQDTPDLVRLAAFLKSPQIDVRTADEAGPTNSGVAGQSGVTLDALQADSACPTAAWVWMVADNMRLIAENGILAAAAILEQSARRVQ